MRRTLMPSRSTYSIGILGAQTNVSGRFGADRQGFDDVGEYDHRNEDYQDGNQYPGHVHGAIP